MDKKEIQSEAKDYCGDILHWINKGDYSSAQRMLTSFRKAIGMWKKEGAQ